MATNPFAPIIRPYLDFLSAHFDNLANESVKHNIQPDDIARDFLGNDQRRESFNTEFMPEISGRTITFWQKNLDTILTEISHLPGLKARFGGDLGPQNRGKLYQRLGIYFDSIIVPDPLLRSITMPGPNKWRDYYILKFSINLVLSRDAYLADVYPPIAVLVGEKHLVQPSDHFPLLSTHSSFDSIVIANKMFGKDFDTFDEVTQFFSSFNDDKSLIREIADQSIFYLDEDVGRDPMEQLAAVDKEHRIHYNEEDMPEIMRGPQRIWQFIHMRTMQANELLLQATDMDAHPVIQAPISFHWLATKVKINSEIMSTAVEENLLTQLPLTNGLLGKNLEWLSNVPVADLIRLRNQGFLDELRKIIGKNLTELSNTEIDDLRKVANQVDYNLNTALNQHQEHLQDVHNKALDGMLAATPSLLITVGAALQPLIGIVPDWISLAIAAVGGGFSLKDVIPKIIQLSKDRRDLGRTPIGILWNAREDSRQQD
jgi:hypothetical protein